MSPHGFAFKKAPIDSVWTAVASTGLDWRSFLHSHKLDAVVLEAESGNQTQIMFGKSLAASSKVILSQWEQRAFKSHAREAFVSI